MTSNFDRRAKPDAAARFSRGRHAKGRMPNFAQLLTNPAVWSMTILTERLTASELDRFRGALVDFAATRGLQVNAPGIVTCFVPTRGPITSDDRGAVLDWLYRSEKVYLVHILRRPRTLGEIGLTTFKSADPEEGPTVRPQLRRVADDPDLRVPYEDVSQEPAVYADEMSQEQPDTDDSDRTQTTGSPPKRRPRATPAGQVRARQVKGPAPRRAGIRAQEKRHGR